MLSQSVALLGCRGHSHVVTKCNVTVLQGTFTCCYKVWRYCVAGDIHMLLQSVTLVLTVLQGTSTCSKV